MPPAAPIVILGSHRAGTSAVAGLLGISGLRLGRVIPPASDNPRGFFESRAVLDANKQLLADMGRDWTCPPLRTDRRIDDSKVVAAVEEIGQGDEPWGFKDPRTLFLLPHWAHHVSGFRFVGVYRPSTAVAVSLQRRNGFSYDYAIAIAHLYTDRLWRLHMNMPFPIVRFDCEREEFLDRMRTLVEAFDLTWDSDSAEQFIGDTRLHGSEVGDAAADVYLAEQAVRPLDDAMPVSSSTVVSVSRRPDVASGTRISSYLGPAHDRRRLRLWDAAIARQDRVGHVIEISPSDSPWTSTLSGCDPKHVSRHRVEEVVDGFGGADRQASHVIAPDLLDTVGAEDLARVLRTISKVTTPDAVCAFGGFLIDSVDSPTELYVPSADETTSVDSSPFLHHRDELEASLLRTPWKIGHVGKDVRDGDRSTVVLVKDSSLRDDGELSPSELRSRVVELVDSSDRLTEHLADLKDGFQQSRVEAERTISELVVERDEAQTAVRELGSAVDDLKLTVARSETRIQEQDTRVDDLAAESDALADSLHTAADRSRSLDGKLAASDRKLATTTRRYERLRNRRIVRLALALARVFRPLFRWVRGQKKTTSARESHPTEGTRPSERRPSRRQVENAILRVRSEKGSEEGSIVSIVILTRDGEAHLRRLFEGLRKRTAYRSFEVIVIDNASSDGTDVVLGDDWGFPLRVIRNERNVSFSEGCNQGLAVADGVYVLLLNNDVDPINPGWLGALVEALENDASLDATGALLIYPEAPPNAGRNALDYELTVQHRGIGFRWRQGTPIGYNLGRGDDPTDPGLVETVLVPGVTAACMLVRAAVLRSFGGLDEAYVYGFEDVDLNLRIREGGRGIAFVGGAALYHHEFGTQLNHGDHRQRAYRTANLHHFAEKWAPRLSRTLQVSDITGEGLAWRGVESRKVAITLTRDDPSGGWGDWHTAHELGDAFAEIGWDVVYAEAFEDRWRELPEDVDLVISLLDHYDVTLAPDGAVTVAWIRNWVERWIDRPWTASFDVLVPSSQISANLLESAGLHVAGVLPLATNPERFRPMESDAVFESDYVFTGNHWGVDRSLLGDLDVAPGERFSIFGKGWDSVGRVSRYWRGPVPYDDLPIVYNATKVVLDDTAGPTLPYGAVNSRVFDALACGTLVLTNNVAGAEDIFDGMLPSYSNREELRSLLDQFLADAEAREATASELQRIVLERHTYAMRARQFIELIRDRLMAPRVALKIGPPGHDEAEQWGDTHFARAFSRSLERLGCATSIDILPEWDLLSTQSADIVVHLRGLVPYVPKPGQVNVLWIISHPEDIPDHECERYDLVLVASDSYADALRGRLNVPVATLLQASEFDATSVEEEQGAADAEEERSGPDVLFVGNSRGVMRHGVAWSLERDLPIAVYGSGWEGLIDESHVVAEHLPNEDLADAYRSAGVVLNDHWPEMRDRGFISNRVFDVLASGGFVISDNVAGIQDVFSNAVPTYEDAEELEQLVRYYQERPAERTALAERGREIVASEHGFDRRAEQFISLALPLLEDRPQTVEPVAAEES